MRTNTANILRFASGFGGLLVILLLALSLPADALGAEGSRQSAQLKFTRHHTGRPSGLRGHIDYVNPDDPNAKPPAVREVDITLARGARYDTSVPALCTASDPELMLLGAAACPDGSVVGQAAVTVDTGFPGPGRIVNANIDFLNNTGQMIYVNTVQGTQARTILRATVHGRHNDLAASFLPGTPPDGGAIDTVSLRQPGATRVIDGRRRGWVTTPSRCPARGFWINRIAFTYADGVTQTVKSRSRCEA